MTPSHHRLNQAAAAIGFAALLVVPAINLFRVDDALDRIDEVDDRECESRAKGREFLIGYIARHGMTTEDIAEANRLGFVTVPNDC